MSFSRLVTVFSKCNKKTNRKNYKLLNLCGLSTESFLAIWLSRYKSLTKEFLIKKMCAPAYLNSEVQTGHSICPHNVHCKYCLRDLDLNLKRDFMLDLKRFYIMMHQNAKNSDPCIAIICQNNFKKRRDASSNPCALLYPNQDDRGDICMGHTSY